MGFKTRCNFDVKTAYCSSSTISDNLIEKELKNCESILQRIRSPYGSMKVSNLFEKASNALFTFQKPRSLLALVQSGKRRLLKSTIAPHLTHVMGKLNKIFVGQGCSIPIAEAILSAKSEILLQTFVWEPHSNSASVIKSALIELNKNTKETKIVVLILFSISKQFWKNGYVDYHYPEKMGLPSKIEVPNLEIRMRAVHNRFRGTLHSKTVIIDRRFVVYTSGNIQVHTTETVSSSVSLT